MEQKRASHNIIPKITVSVCTTRLLKSICRRLPKDKGFNVKKAFEFICFGRAKLVFKKLSKYIEIYKNEEFKNGYGEARLVGNSVLINWSNYGGLSGLGFPELWKAFYEEEIGSYDKLLMMSFMLASTGAPKDDDDYDEEDEEDIKADQKSSNTFEPLANRMYAGITYRGLQKDLRKMPYYEQMSDIIEALAYEYKDEPSINDWPSICYSNYCLC